jgi:hypothetical protein
VEQAFIARTLSQDRQLSVRLIKGGNYLVTLDTTDKEQRAKKTLATKTSGLLATLEASTVLIESQQSLSDTERKTAIAAAQKTISLRGVSGIERFAALSILKQLNTRPVFSLVPQIFAQSDALHDYLKAQCGKDGLTADEYWSEAYSAGLYGYTDVEEHCKAKAQRIIMEQTEAILAMPDPNPGIVVAQIFIVRQFELPPSYEERLKKKIEEKSRKKAEELLKKLKNAKPKTRQEYEALMDEIRETLLPGEEGGLTSDMRNSLEEYLQNLAFAWAKMVLENSSGLSLEQMQIIIEQAQVRGITTEQSDVLFSYLFNRFDISGQQVLNTPAATYVEVYYAMLREQDPALKKKLEARYKELKKKYWYS